MTRLVLDAGAFVAVERGDLEVMAILRRARERKIPLVTTAPVVGQVWRNGRKQANLARLLKAVNVLAPNEQSARTAGLLLAKTGTTDIVDALVVELCTGADIILTSDPKDLARLVQAASMRPAVHAL
jgi:PIN domain nuclease of toxin-antitoxin system